MIEARLHAPNGAGNFKAGIMRAFNRRIGRFNVSVRFAGMDETDIPVINATYGTASGGHGVSAGRGAGGIIIVNPRGGPAKTRIQAAHEFGHVMTLEHHDDPGNVMKSRDAQSFAVSEWQIQEAITNCGPQEKGGETQNTWAEWNAALSRWAASGIPVSTRR